MDAYVKKVYFLVFPLEINAPLSTNFPVIFREGFVKLRL